MTATQYLGLLLVCSPVIGYFAAMSYHYGWRKAIKYQLIALAIVASIYLPLIGGYLLHG